MLLTVAVSLLMWAAARYLPGMRAELPLRRPLTIALFALGAGVCLLAMVAVARAGTTANPVSPEKASRLVTTGIYRWTRNPMYLGLVMLVLAWGVRLSNPVSLVLVIGFAGYLHRFQIIPEERALAARFGDAYREYRGKVRRWL